MTLSAMVRAGVNAGDIVWGDVVDGGSSSDDSSSDSSDEEVEVSRSRSLLRSTALLTATTAGVTAVASHFAFRNSSSAPHQGDLWRGLIQGVACLQGAVSIGSVMADRMPSISSLLRRQHKVSLVVNRRNLTPTFWELYLQLKDDTKVTQVTFDGEKGIDEGGLSKEFIDLLFNCDAFKECFLQCDPPILQCDLKGRINGFATLHPDAPLLEEQVRKVEKFCQFISMASETAGVVPLPLSEEFYETVVAPIPRRKRLTSIKEWEDYVGSLQRTEEERLSWATTASRSRQERMEVIFGVDTEAEYLSALKEMVRQRELVLLGNEAFWKTALGKKCLKKQDTLHEELLTQDLRDVLYEDEGRINRGALVFEKGGSATRGSPEWQLARRVRKAVKTWFLQYEDDLEKLQGFCRYVSGSEVLVPGDKSHNKLHINISLYKSQAEVSAATCENRCTFYVPSLQKQSVIAGQNLESYVLGILNEISSERSRFNTE